MKLSIITINLNNAIGLRKTIESVISQTFKDYEYIIIDGASVDGSIEILKEFSDQLTCWVSEPDKGIYNAMNKGIKLAKGEYLLMMNSGDVFYKKNTLKRSLEFGLNKDLVYGDILEIVNEHELCNKKFPEKLLFSFFYKYSLGHQAIFVKRTLHDTIGPYFESFKIVSDWCFFTLAVCKYNCSYKHIPIIVAATKRDGVSCDLNNMDLMISERKKFLDQFFPHLIQDYYEIDSLRDENKLLKYALQKEIDNRLLNKTKKLVRNTIYYPYRLHKRLIKSVFKIQKESIDVPKKRAVTTIKQF